MPTSHRHDERAIRWSLAALLAALGFLGPAGPAAAVTLYGIRTSQNVLVWFDSAAPQVILATVPLVGLRPDEHMAAIDGRPATGDLLGVGLRPAGDGNLRVTLYVIDPASGHVTGPTGPVIPLLSTLPPTSALGVDFNPNVDRLRVVSASGDQGRINPNSSATFEPDTALNPGTVQVTGIAYDRNDLDLTTPSTVYGIDTASAELVTIGGPDGIPSPTLGGVIAVGPLGVNATGDAGLDIAPDGTLFAALTVDGQNGLYTIDPATGTATLVGPIGSGGLGVGGLAVALPRILPAPGVLVVSPPGGSYAAGQSLDLRIFVDAPGRVVTGGRAIIDGTDVTPVLLACLVGARPDSQGLAVRCPALLHPEAPSSARRPLALGTHVLHVQVNLDDGSSFVRVLTFEIR